MRRRLAGAVAIVPLLAAAPANAAADELGLKVFNQISQPPCMACHTLKAAGASGKVGPSLDELKPDLDQVLSAVRGGVGIMPAFEDKLSSEQIEAVARFVSGAAGR